MSFLFDGHKLKIARVPKHHEGGWGRVYRRCGDEERRAVYLMETNSTTEECERIMGGWREERGGGEEKRRAFYLMDTNSKSKQR